jgi:hypothetical protein
VAEERRRSQTTGGKLVATVIRDLPQGVAAFDAMGRSVQRPKPGIYFLRTAATAVPQKVLLVE